MNIKDMKVDPQLIDATQLDDEEQKKVMHLLAVYGETLITIAMTKGVAGALQLAAGAALRMVKANQGLQTFTVDDLKGRLKRG